MSDISIKIRDQIINDFKKNIYDQTGVLNTFYKPIAKGIATEEQSYKFAKAISALTNGLFKKYINDDILTNGKLYEEYANDIILPLLEENYGIISKYCKDVIKEQYRKLSIGLNPIKPKMDVNRAKGLVKIATESENYKEIEESFSQKVENFNYHIVDESIKQNAEFMANSGVSTTITRMTMGETCEWCNKLAGTYVYPGVPSEVFMRHDNCDCVIKVKHYKQPGYYMKKSGNAFVRTS